MNQRSWYALWQARRRAVGTAQTGPFLLMIRDPSFHAEMMAIYFVRRYGAEHVPAPSSRVIVPKVQTGRPGAKGRRGRH